MIIYQADAFTDKPFAGNPAGVCLLEVPGDEEWMQDIAREMNLPETAFLCREGESYRLHWFTPKVEVDLCGHATLAAAHILWETGVLGKGERALFETRRGRLGAKFKGEWIELDFPAEPENELEAPAALSKALGERPLYVGKNRFDYLVEVEGEETVRGLSPDFRMLATIPARGFIVTAASAGKNFDFVSRFFAPAAGIDEDPVTGSAHCCLGPYWGKKMGKHELIGYQASARGGTVRIRLAGGRVFLSGKAVTVLRCELLV